MLDRKQRRMVMKLFSGGMGVSEIAEKVGVSRQSVYRVIQSDFEQDEEIHALKKQLKKAELERKIREVRKPLKTSNELAVLKKAVDGLVTSVLGSRYMNPKLRENPPVCVYCGEGMEYVVEKGEEMDLAGYRCNRCGRNFLFPA